MAVSRAVLLRCVLAGVVIGSCAAGAASADAEAERREALAAETAARRIDAVWPSAGGSPAARFVARLGERLAATAGPSPFAWRFSVVRDRSLEAFSIGGGRIYVSDGSVLVCEEEGELAAVLAHEMGHQLGGHFRPVRRAPEDALLDWLGLGPPPQKPGITIGAIRHVFDADKEDEADRISLRVLAAAGYDPRVAVRIAERQAARAKDAAGRRAAAHRADVLRRLVAATPHGGTTNTEEFRELRARLAAELPTT